ncbi:MAG: potassium/proton antiporter, partial [Thermoguttaceae bacterium]|nr:potassium/proton antiporter [Thermoguttaceae bacterium]
MLDLAASSLPFQYAVVALLLFLGIFASKISSWVKIPTLLMILFLGMLAGSEGIGKIRFDDYDAAVKIGTLGLIFILFSGGYDTSWSSVRKVLVPGTILSTFGVLLTAVLTGLFAAWLLDWNWRSGILLGAVISSTDAAAVFALFRSQSSSLKGDLRPILEYESGSNDPMATFLTLFMIDLMLDPSASVFSIFYLMPLRIGVGTLVGFLIGRYVARLMNHAKLDYDGLYYVIGIATVFLAYGLSELFAGNGFMAVYVCGLTMGNSRFLFKHGLGRFHDGIAWLMQVSLFLSLGLLVTPSQLPGIALYGAVLAVFLMFAARPVSVFVSLIGSSFNFREKLLISWGGIRGAAPIVLSIFPCLSFHKNPELFTNANLIYGWPDPDEAEELDTCFSLAARHQEDRINTAQICSLIIRRIMQIAGSGRGEIVSCPYSYIQDVLKYVADNLSDRCSVDQVAEQFKVGRSKFQADFRAVTGIPYHQYLIRLRLKLAYDMIIEGNSIVKTAMECGYSSEAHFIKAFR